MNKVDYKSKKIMLLGCFSAACLSLIIILFSTYSMNKVRIESDFISQRILPGKTFSLEILTSLINQEIGIRAYIASENKVFLEPYYLASKGKQRYHDSLNKLREIGLNNDNINRIDKQRQYIQGFFQQQISLVESGGLDKAKLNLSKSRKLVDEFRVTDNMLLNDINSQINTSSNKVVKTQKIHKYSLVFLGIILIACNFIFISCIWNCMHKQIKKKDEVNEDLQKILTSQEQYITSISHELKTPLNVILSAAQLLDMYCDSGLLYENKNSTVKHIDSIKQNAYRLSKFINNIIDLSRIESGIFELNLSNNNIVEVVEDMVMAVTEFTKSRGLNITFDTDVEEKIIACDPEKVDKVVLNLISNAIKFSSDGGQIFVNIKNNIEFVEISVEDNGIGIDTKYFHSIFNKYSQIDKSLSRNAEGTGVGLTLVKSIVELSGGSINVESELGIGSKFTVRFPSKQVLNEKIQFNNAMRNEKQNIKVEFSDLY
ncbi:MULTISPECIES: sensor histidine kinase [Clostridium]|uniref:histidine kinase n=1 Tax=Clostridium frigoriphilum TaxID=443253 RepID=A0ABU7URX1_9CLOT|nr:ATP-binding protein [Clostridium sp. DSM 17811]MBU3101097.1 CHASE3 domain-containing protein [Clostridium sp. DSM 17811]